MMFSKIGALKITPKFYENIFDEIILSLEFHQIGLWHWCFLANFAKFFKT